MITLIIILVMALVILAIALAVSVRIVRGGKAESDDARYLDEDGDHVYYNESIIAKKEFRRRFPNEEARTWKRLFHKK